MAPESECVSERGRKDIGKGILTDFHWFVCAQKKNIPYQTGQVEKDSHVLVKKSIQTQMAMSTVRETNKQKINVSHGCARKHARMLVRSYASKCWNVLIKPVILDGAGGDGTPYPMQCFHL